MSLCVGVDLSTKRVDLAAIPLDPDIAGGPWHRSIEGFTVQSLRDQFLYALCVLGGHADADIVSVAIEKPAGKFVHPSLHELYGALCVCVPYRIVQTGLYPVEWRQALGLTGKAKNNKAAGLARVLELYPSCHDWDEHQLDSLGIARAWRDIQWRATEGAA